MHHHLNIEDIIREVLSKICSLHGKHPNIEIGKDYKLNISACCQEFHGQLEDIIKDYQLRIQRAVSWLQRMKVTVGVIIKALPTCFFLTRILWKKKKNEEE